MSKHVRPGAKPLQIRASAWVHEVIEQRTAVPGVEKWMVVERLMKAGLDAEAKSRTPRQASAPPPLDWREYKDVFLTQTYVRAEHCLEKFFGNDVTEFMRTLREAQDPKQPLPASEWKRWTKHQQIPEDHMPTVLSVLKVLDAVSRNEDAYMTWLAREIQASRQSLAMDASNDK